MSDPARRVRVAALCRVALATLDGLAAHGRETSDVPRLWVDATLRWAHGEAPAHDVAPLTRTLFQFLEGSAIDDPSALFVVLVCAKIRVARRRGTPRPTLRGCAWMWVRVTRERDDAAETRVAQWFRAALAEEERAHAYDPLDPHPGDTP